MKLKLPALMIVLIFFVVMYVYDSNGPNVDNPKFKEIEQLWSTVPLYPGMVEVDSSMNSAGRKAHISKYYKLDAPYEGVKRFYVEKLVEQGWSITQERQMGDWGRDLGGQYLKFRKSEYELSMQFAGEKADYGWDYSIGIYWNDE